MNMDSKDDIGQAIAREISQTIAKKIAIGIALFFGFLFFIAIGGIFVQLLWNWLLPDIVGVRRVTFWEALGLLALSRILFGGFGMSGSHGHSSDRRPRGNRVWWKKTVATCESPTAPPAAPSE
jgi:hypothetical protein